MFIRKRLSSLKPNTFSYQVLESYRQDGKIKLRLICNLGKHASPVASEAYTRQLEGLEAEIKNPPQRYLTGQRIPPVEQLKHQAGRIAYAERTRRRIEELRGVVARMTPMGDKSDTTEAA